MARVMCEWKGRGKGRESKLIWLKVREAWVGKLGDVVHTVRHSRKTRNIASSPQIAPNCGGQ